MPNSKPIPTPGTKDKGPHTAEGAGSLAPQSCPEFASAFSPNNPSPSSLVEHP